MGPAGGSFLRRASDENIFKVSKVLEKEKSFPALASEKLISVPDIQVSIVDYHRHIQIALIELNLDPKKDLFDTPWPGNYP